MRYIVLCALMLMGSPTAPNVRHLGRNVVVAAGERVRNADCLLCSVEVRGQTTGSVRVFAGNVFLNGSIEGNLLVFGGHVTLGSGAKVGGQIFIFGGHLHQDSGDHAHTVLPPIVLLPAMLIVCLVFTWLISLTRRAVRQPTTYHPLPRL